MTHKFPLYLTNLHAPILVLIHFGSLSWVTPENYTTSKLLNDLVNVDFFLSVGLLTNCRWIFTVPVIYQLKFITDLTLILQLVMVVILLSYYCYQSEYSTKMQFL